MPVSENISIVQDRWRKDMGVSEETKEKSEANEPKRIGTASETKTRGDSIHQAYRFAEDVKLKECKYCCVMIPKKAKICPNCKMSLKSHWFLKSVAAVLAVVVIGLGSYCLSAYWGLADGSAISGWMAQSTVLSPAVAGPDISGTNADMMLVEAAETGKEQAGTEKEKISVSPVTAGAQTSGDDVGSGKADTAVGKGQETSGISAAPGEKKQEATGEGVTAEGEKQEIIREDSAPGSKKQEASKGNGTSDKERQEDSKESAAEGLKKQDTSKAGNTDTARVTGSTADDELAQDINDEAEGMETGEDVREDEENPAKTDADKAAFCEKCVQADYRSLLRQQEDYLGEAVVVEAQVIRQVEGGLFDEHIYYLCMVQEKDGFERYYIIRDDRETEEILILEGDRLVIYGKLFGDCKIPAALVESQPVVPAISMLYSDLK